MEVEIKLHVLPTVEGGPEALFERLATITSLAGEPLGPVERIALRDVYYDTVDGALARARAGLRLRVKNGARWITLKVSRHREGALTAREEYEEPLDDQHLRQVLARIRPLIGPDPVPLPELVAGQKAGPLVPVLDVRTARQARTAGETATLTLDRVEYPGLAARTYFDIEVEARTDLVGEVALRQAEAELSRLAAGHLAPSQMSKLERGLRLKAGSASSSQ